ncbi:unnamed protein product [Acanthoscelides obtectus]|uniref:Protein AF-10 n=1 Tax=Acanthoscelides obtectus TaxID=200917 RepID=A0A9P0P5P1_ACAOB|nr:unnamed protein product [Acanthoscelides obtectus]CAK1622874.1 Protein AF-10 [Acanthoscelides obtectus]
MREMVGGCCVCSDDRGWSENPLVYCDGQSCTVAVHQACYGIVTVPTGPWFCRKCESQERSVKVKCELCPSKYGALKRTDNQGWAHVVCALYIPEVRFGNVTTMEPIQLQLIPAERFSKLCYICEEKGKPANATVGACMQCNKAGCKQQFHVTCAQSLGLLCEEAGNYLDNVKYCGYCQHHYSKLKKGGNVKTIPPYKPVSNESHNSDSEKESETSNSKNSPPSSSTKKRSSVSGKNAPTKTATKSNSGSGSQKAVHNNSKGSDKAKAGSKSGKSDDPSPVGSIENSPVTEKKTPPDSPAIAAVSDKDSGKNKKRKANSRTPTPVSTSVVPPVPLSASLAGSEVSVVVTSSAVVTASPTVPSLLTGAEKKSLVTDSANDKAKKAKIETTQSILSNQPVVALTSITAPVKVASPTSSADVVTSVEHPTTSTTIAPPQTHSLVVSVPLSSAHLSPHHTAHGTPVLVVNGQTVGSTLLGGSGQQSVEKAAPTGSGERNTPIISDLMTGNNSNQGLLTSEMSGGGLKITYEKQVDSINTEVDMELELDTTPAITTDVPARRGRSQSQSNDKQQTPPTNSGTIPVGRGKKRSTSTTAPAIPPTANNGAIPKRSSRSRPSGSPTVQETPPGAFVVPPLTQDVSPAAPGAFAAVTQMKESPPSSPSSESLQSAPPTIGRGRPRGRKSGTQLQPGTPPTGNGTREDRDSPPVVVEKKDVKEIKVFQNGLTAPHMLGNQLNPTSNMHSKMHDHLNSELEAHSIFNANENNSNLVGPQLHHRVLQSARASSTTSSTASGGSGLSSMLGGSGGTIPQTLDQLLERQWEQGSQFLMEQAQHFDIASLLSCLHQLRAENLRLEDHVSSLLQRRDHLLAVNARLAIPLTGQPAATQSNHPHTVNNIHPSVASSHGDLPRSRHSTGSSSYPSHTQSTHTPLENGLPPDAYPQNSHRSPAGGQPSPTVRHHSPAGAYVNSGSGSNSGNGGLSQPHRPDSSGRHAPRPQPFPLYDTRPGPSSSASQQVGLQYANCTEYSTSAKQSG